MTLHERITQAMNNLRAQGIEPESIRLTEGGIDLLRAEVRQMVYMAGEKSDVESVARFYGLPVVEGKGGISAVLGWRNTNPVAAYISHT